MAINTFNVLNERDLTALLRDHMNHTARQIADALFNGPRPLIDAEAEPWSVAIALEVVAARAADTTLPKPALMLIVGRTLGIPTVGIHRGDSSATVGAALARDEQTAGTGYKNEDPLCSLCDRPSLCKVIRQGSRPCDKQDAARQVDRTTLKPGEPIRVVRAFEVTRTVMTALSEHPVTKDAMDSGPEELRDLYETLNKRIAAMIGEGLH